MKIPFFLAVFCAFIVVTAAPAKADGIPLGDPKMIPKGGNAGGCGSTPITLEPFIFSVDGAGNSTSSGECFRNSSSSPITSLTVTTFNPPAVAGDSSPCNSESYVFSNSPLFEKVSCAYNLNAKLLTVTFFGTNSDFPGIPVNTDFYMNLAGWNPNEAFTGTAVASEPQSLLLLVAGLGAVFVFCRRRLANNTA